MYRETMGKKITCKPIPYQSFIKMVKKNYFAQPFPSRDSKNKQIQSGPWQLATVLIECEKIGLLMYRNLLDPLAELYLFFPPYLLWKKAPITLCAAEVRTEPKGLAGDRDKFQIPGQ